MTLHTSYINLTHDELLTSIYSKEDATPLEIELAQRLEALIDEVDCLSRESVSLEDILAQSEAREDEMRGHLSDAEGRLADIDND